MSSLPPGTALGIDFGTSHTIAVVRRVDGSVRPLLFDGAPLMPSAVCADADGGVMVGRDALYSGRRHPERFEPNPKRHIDRASVLLGEQEFAVVDLIAAVLRAVADECRRVVGPPRQVTITVPAEWGPARRQIIENAAARSGLGRVRLVPEPVAAATYFAQTLNRHIAIGSSIVVYDLGAGTFDASVVRRTALGFETVALDGRNDLGGLDIDAAIVNHLAQTYGGHDGWQRLTKPTTVEERRSFREFHDEIRGAKERLSRHQSADFSIPLLEIDAHLTRTELEQIAAPLLEETIRVTQAVMRTAGLDPSLSAGVFLVGGASRMPLVATMLHRAFGVAPTVLDQPEVVVAEGSVLWTEPVRSPVTPQAPLMPTTPQYPPQRYAQVTPQATLPPQADLTIVPGQPSPQQTPPVPPDPQVQAKRKRFSRKMIVAVIVVDILIVATLMFVFRPDGAADEQDSTSDLMEGAETFALLEPVIDGHDGAIISLEAVETEDGPLLYTTGADRILNMWSLESGDNLDGITFSDSTEILGETTFSDGRTKLVAMGSDGSFFAWEPDDLTTNERLYEGASYSSDDPVVRDTIGPNNGSATYAMMNSAKSYLWDLENGTDVTGDITFNQDQLNSIRNFAVFEDRIGLVTVDAEGRLRLYETEVNVDTGMTFDAADDWTDDDAPESLGVVYIEDVPHAMVLSRQRYFLWDLETGDFAASTATWEGDLDANFVQEAVTVDGGDALLAYDDDSDAAVYDLHSGTELAVFTDEDDPSNMVTDMTSTVVDGYTIAITGHLDGTVRLWNLGN
ncbi:Hsp70 family protein [Glycomyces tarimensis]